MTSKLLLLALFVMSTILMSYTSTKKKKVLFFGDSITQAAVNPGGYIKRIDSMISAEGLNDKYETIGAGISGNKVYDLYLRLEEDVLAKSPDIVVIYIGVNDVWHKTSSGTGTDYDKFGKFYQAIVRKLQAANIKVILCTPAVIGEKTDNSNQQDGDMNQYSHWIRSFAAQENLPLIDLRKMFIDYNLQHNTTNAEKGILTVDRVHLNATGNELVAEAMWNAIKAVK
ncbi:MAG: G-D-S-L family lipolytic protein [Bacteroidota bacterium]|nr:G-D-S-L family lipolytic protein [Bacteroidota bacterium]